MTVLSKSKKAAATGSALISASGLADAGSSASSVAGPAAAKGLVRSTSTADASTPGSNSTSSVAADTSGVDRRLPRPTTSQPYGFRCMTPIARPPAHIRLKVALVEGQPISMPVPDFTRGAAAIHGPLGQAALHQHG